MKSTRNELRAKVDSLIDEIDKLVELPKKPTFEKIEEIVDYIQKNKENSRFDKTPYGFSYAFILKEREKYDRYIKDYMTEILTRGSEWDEKAENLFSRILREETGMSYEDSIFIRQPLYSYTDMLSHVDNLAASLENFGVGFYLTYKNKLAPLHELKFRYNYNPCEAISLVYRKSISSIIGTMASGLISSDNGILREKFFEKIILPDLGTDLRSEEYEITKSIKENNEMARKAAEEDIEKHKQWIVSDIEQINYLYQRINQEEGSIRKSFAAHLDRLFCRKR